MLSSAGGCVVVVVVVVVDLQAGCLWQQDGDSAAVRVKLKSGNRARGCDELCQLCCPKLSSFYLNSSFTAISGYTR